MARRKKDGVEGSNEGSEEARKPREKADHVFELHHPDGTVEPMRLVMHYPSEVAIVLNWIKNGGWCDTDEGTVRVCKKIYS